MATLAGSEVHYTKKIYFVSDAHLGTPNPAESRIREKLLVQWLDEIKNSAEEIYILGDLFDFWFEYDAVIPKGFSRILGKLAELTDSGISIHFFTGNHDLWMNNYFEDELQIAVYHEPVVKTIRGKLFYLAHGDGLGPGDYGHKFLKIIFRNPLCRWLFKWIHPDIGVPMAHYWSRRSRYVSAGGQIEPFQGEERERLICYSQKLLESRHYDFLVFGHRHLPLDISINQKSRFINLGDWITFYTYAEFDGQHFAIKHYSQPPR
ncbi:MAG: UDP-2,3-diacylglucosamine hydrolase [Chitinophagales bacterium]|nr:MAG: UDP-2,3-diacylglucosamine hydrolase [Chitinophagales bacterium]